VSADVASGDGPFKGLSPFEEGDAPFFFGRERDTEVTTANLFAAPLTVLYGPSGVGKTSLLGAGVTHRLRRRDDVLVVAFRDWTADPVAGVRAAVAAEAAARVGAEVGLPDEPALSAYLGGCARSLGRRLMIILDQFEEHFLYAGELDDFEVELVRSVAELDEVVSFVISIREDAFAGLDRFEGYIPGLYDNYIRIDHLDLPSAARAIEGPVERYSAQVSEQKRVRVEPELVLAVLAQVARGKVAIGGRDHGIGRSKSTEHADLLRVETPYLQLVMKRVWDEEVAAGSRVLRLATLERLGGAEEIMREHVAGAFETLGRKDGYVAAQALRYLVTPSGTKIAHTATDLADFTGVQEANLQAVLGRLASPESRILRVVPGPEDSDEERYEISHDALAPAVLEWRARHLQERELSERAVDVVALALHAAIGLFIVLAAIGSALYGREVVQHVGAAWFGLAFLIWLAVSVVVAAWWRDQRRRLWALVLAGDAAALLAPLTLLLGLPALVFPRVRRLLGRLGPIRSRGVRYRKRRLRRGVLLVLLATVALAGFAFLGGLGIAFAQEGASGISDLFSDKHDRQGEFIAWYERRLEQVPAVVEAGQEHQRLLATVQQRGFDPALAPRARAVRARFVALRTRVIRELPDSNDELRAINDDLERQLTVSIRAYDLYVRGLATGDRSAIRAGDERLNEATAIEARVSAKLLALQRKLDLLP
jgi:hypothetical protein